MKLRIFFSNDLSIRHLHVTQNSHEPNSDQIKYSLVESNCTEDFFRRCFFFFKFPALRVYLYK